MERNGIADARLAQTAVVRDMPSVRFWADEVPTDVIAEVRRRLPNMPLVARDAKRVNGRPVVETLALSGGGADGAFGAGVLSGWSARGDRPEFEIVTGVSAGAIIAPFAYLGERYDKTLKEIWTHYQTNEIITAQILPGLFGGPALADTSPLASLIARYIDDKMLADIAAEYSRGRILMVLTTNLDAQRPVVWNMGEIARTGDQKALDLFRKVILASAAIPGAFPPVSIDVEAGGKAYEEMHVDGGTTREVFVLPMQAPFKAFDPLYAAQPLRKLYIIKNGMFEVQGQAAATGNGVVVVFKGANAELIVRGGGSVSFKAPGTAATNVAGLNGFVLFQDKTTTQAGRTTIIQGGGDVKLEGILYLPTWRVDIGGNGDVNQTSQYFTMVADSYYMEGNGKLYLASDAAGANLPDLMPRIKNGPKLVE